MEYVLEGWTKPELMVVLECFNVDFDKMEKQMPNRNRTDIKMVVIYMVNVLGDAPSTNKMSVAELQHFIISNHKDRNVPVPQLTVYEVPPAQGMWNMDVRELFHQTANAIEGKPVVADLASLSVMKTIILDVIEFFGPNVPPALEGFMKGNAASELLPMFASKQHHRAAFEDMFLNKKHFYSDATYIIKPTQRKCDTMNAPAKDHISYTYAPAIGNSPPMYPQAMGNVPLMYGPPSNTVPSMYAPPAPSMYTPPAQSIYAPPAPSMYAPPAPSMYAPPAPSMYAPPATANISQMGAPASGNGLPFYVPPSGTATSMFAPASNLIAPASADGPQMNVPASGTVPSMYALASSVVAPTSGDGLSSYTPASGTVPSMYATGMGNLPSMNVHVGGNVPPMYALASGNVPRMHASAGCKVTPMYSPAGSNMPRMHALASGNVPRMHAPAGGNVPPLHAPAISNPPPPPGPPAPPATPAPPAPPAPPAKNNMLLMNAPVTSHLHSMNPPASCSSNLSMNASAATQYEPINAPANCNFKPISAPAQRNYNPIKATIKPTSVPSSEALMVNTEMNFEPSNVPAGTSSQEPLPRHAGNETQRAGPKGKSGHAKNKKKDIIALSSFKL